MLDILLINPNNSEISDFGEGILPPLGICYISSYLKSKKIKSEVLDANALNLSIQDILETVESKQPKIIGLTGTTPLILRIYKLASKIKESFPDIKIVVGGPHVSVLPERTLKECSSIDMIVRGEGEITSYELVTAIKNQSPFDGIDGLAYRKNEKVLLTSPQTRILNLDSLPFPDRSDLPIKKYMPSIKWFNRAPFATVMTSRGCPNDCVFCASKLILGRAVRFRSPQNVLKEIRELKNKYGIKEVMFYDDTFTLNKERIYELCDLFVKSNINITWGCLSRVDRIDEDLLSKMKEAGCHIMSYGVESGSERMLGIIRKNVKLDQIEKAIKTTKDVGIKTSASFVFGVPGETKESIEKTINFALKIDPLFAQFYRVVPFPGTDLYNVYLEKNGDKEIDWQSFLEIGNAKNIIELKNINEEEFGKLLKESYRKFYWRPKKIIQIFFKMLTPRKFKGLLIAAYAFLLLSLKKKDV